MTIQSKYYKEKARAGKSVVTTDHHEIKEWIEARGGKPATVSDTATNGIGILRIDFPGHSGDESLREISWKEFFDKFEESNLAFLYQEETGERTSRFNKLVSRS